MTAARTSVFWTAFWGAEGAQRLCRMSGESEASSGRASLLASASWTLLERWRGVFVVCVSLCVRARVFIHILGTDGCGEERKREGFISLLDLRQANVNRPLLPRKYAAFDTELGLYQN